MSYVVNELLESQELDPTQRAPVAPVDPDLQLSTLVQVDAEPLVPRLLRAGAPRGLGHRLVIKLDHSADLVCKQRKDRMLCVIYLSNYKYELHTCTFSFNTVYPFITLNFSLGVFSERNSCVLLRPVFRTVASSIIV